MPEKRARGAGLGPAVRGMMVCNNVAVAHPVSTAAHVYICGDSTSAGTPAHLRDRREAPRA